MASHSDSVHRFRSLKLETHSDDLPPSAYKVANDLFTSDREEYPRRPQLRNTADSQDTIRATATPPISIPSLHDHAGLAGSGRGDASSNSYMDHFMRHRNGSAAYDNEAQEDDDDQDHALDHIPRIDSWQRGRAMHQVMADEPPTSAQGFRSHSESNVDDYDPVTGRHVARHAGTPRPERAHVGESRFPLLQGTVDEMARESSDHVPHATSLTSRSTMSPKHDEARTPQDHEGQYPFSPVPVSPSRPMNIATSYESSRKPFRRTASQRWRDGESSQPQDFFSRAGSMRKGTKESSWRSSSRRDTFGSTKSPNSVASSYLRGFSVGSHFDEAGGNPAVDAEGQTIGEDYVLGKQIGFGGFSVVKEVTQLSSETGKQRKLAVKIVRRQIEGKNEAENEAAQAEFEHEVELWRFLSHPHILPLEAVYKLEEATFCFIPLNTGGTLFDLIRSNRGGLSLDLARAYAYQLASALRYLHLDARVVHRDIKLENCLVDTTNGQPGIVRVCDFGMAEWITHDGRSSPEPSSNLNERPLSRNMGPADSSTSAFAGGSLEYAAPEVVRVASSASMSGIRKKSTEEVNRIPSPLPPSSTSSLVKPDLLSPAVDIWSYGVCLFSMIMGKRPFSDSFMPRVVMAILAGEWDRDAFREKTLSNEDLYELVDGCLQLKDRDRWDIEQVADCAWFEEQREISQSSEDDEGRGGWRL